MTDAAIGPTKLRYSPSSFVVAGYAVVFLAFGVFGTWAATAPLQAGVVAQGVVSVESSRKTIQHLEGGIVSEIMVQEGDRVVEGQELVALQPTQALGNVAVLRNRQAFLLATEARLVAESLDAPAVDFPVTIMNASTNEATDAIATQDQLFRDRKASKDGQIGILRSRIEQLTRQIEGLGVQLEAVESQRGSLDEELARLTGGQSQGVVATNQLSQMQRLSAELQGDYGQLVAQVAQTNQSVAETELQILQTSQEFRERASSELKEVRDQLNEVNERLLLATDVLDRTVLRAPVDGIVQNIQVHTQRGVVRPAESIMEIVPLEDDLIVNARVRPLDIDTIQAGDMAEVRFSAFSSRTTPLILGHVRVLSSDIIQPDDARIEPYYLARIEVPEEQIPDEIRGRLVPGMPADVIIATGERTLVEYLLRPIQDAFAKGMREQ